VGVSIGVNTGPARVGNVGSAVKFKYGALGDTVNMGSRVQGHEVPESTVAHHRGDAGELGPLLPRAACARSAW